MDLVGIEPTTSSMPWKRKNSRSIVFKQLSTGRLGGNRYIRRYFRPIFRPSSITSKGLHGRGLCGPPHLVIAIARFILGVETLNELL